MICYAIVDDEIDERFAELLKVRLNSLTNQSNLNVLEIAKAILSNPDISRKRLLPKDESEKPENLSCFFLI